MAIPVDPWPSDHRAVVATFQVPPAPMPDMVGTSVASVESGRRDPSADVRLETTKLAYRVGEPIDIRWAGGPGYRWDWIAVFRAPAEELRDAYLIWEHTDAREAGSVRLDGGSAEVDQSPAGGRWPLPPGTTRRRTCSTTTRGGSLGGVHDRRVIPT